MKNKKDFVTERFNAALILGAALLTLVVVCEISFLRARIATQLDLRTRTAITLLKNTDESLFSELEILKETIISLDVRHEAMQSKLYADLIRNVVKSSHRFDAIFYLRARGAEQESLAHFSSDARISDLGEIRLADIRFFNIKVFDAIFGLLAGYNIVFFDIVCALGLIGVIIKRACLQREDIPSYDVIAVKLACAVASAFDRTCYVIDAKH